MSGPVVELRGIRKSFGPVEVLHGVDFDVRPGEVHVLAGENGAGKSTLVNILSGVHRDYVGEMRLHGRPVRFTGPAGASRAGVATIHQELSLVPTMTVADNLFLGRERTDRCGRVDFAAQERDATRLLAEAGLDVTPRQLVAELPLPAQQMLEITRALARDAALVILDEPTSALSEPEADVLFRRIATLRDAGRSIVYISHKMEEIYRLADRITVLRDGDHVGTDRAADLPPDELVARLADGGILSVSTPEWERAAERFEEVERHDTYLAGDLVILRGPHGLVALESPRQAERVLRPLADDAVARQFVADRLALYERMWDGCGCKVDYYH